MTDKKENEKSEQFFKDIEIEFLIHELKDPISIIETGARTLIEKQSRFGPLLPRQEKTLTRIVRNAQKAREMLYSLLEVGRSETGSFICNKFMPDYASYHVLISCLEMQAPPIADALSEYTEKSRVLEFLATQNIFFEVKPSVQGLEMFQDETKFRQILSNLIKNALHFRQKRFQLILNLHNENLLVDVVDDGPGIPAEHHQAIFKRYTQLRECALTARSGHGLGLAGARIMARCLGGEIDISSKVGEGTAFRLTIPVQLSAHS
jgi:two-component system OmpR family sensor kinase